MSGAWCLPELGAAGPGWPRRGLPPAGHSLGRVRHCPKSVRPCDDNDAAVAGPAPDVCSSRAPAARPAPHGPPPARPPSVLSRRKPPAKQRPRLRATSGGLGSVAAGPLHSASILCAETRALPQGGSPARPMGCRLTAPPRQAPRGLTAERRGQGWRKVPAFLLATPRPVGTHSPHAAHRARILESCPEHRPRQGLAGSPGPLRPSAQTPLVTTQIPLSVRTDGSPHTNPPTSPWRGASSSRPSLSPTDLLGLSMTECVSRSQT